MAQGTMRLALKWGMWLVTSVYAAIIYRLVFKDDVDYIGIATLIGSLGVFIGALAAAKWGEKREETKKEISPKP